METNEIKDLLALTMQQPFAGQVSFNFDLANKEFIISAPIFRSVSTPLEIRKYVESRKGKNFLPHETSFCFGDSGEVRVVQKIPFHLESRPTTRQMLLEFLRLAKRCHQMLAEMAAEHSTNSEK
jgi:hypothetical protein